MKNQTDDSICLGQAKEPVCSSSSNNNNNKRSPLGKQPEINCQLKAQAGKLCKVQGEKRAEDEINKMKLPQQKQQQQSRQPFVAQKRNRNMPTQRKCIQAGAQQR
ncbi:PREDICTED: uncharacterized protein LOC108617025 [Drosophila arizonae]|uniref:Uncharacterized protein LOC108617025 n=1 Tax=Drosophila arizonae TaxID=7263 RepID=A0ABM1PLP4_DROAR|nr:PREDICTED: uncharacterized protein LOC108617025 [Drosophila arizonae]